MFRLLVAIAISLPLFAFGARAQAPLPPIELYGNLPTISAISISPDGSHLAFIQRDNDINIVRVLHLESNETVYGVSLGDAKANQVSWASEKHVIISAYETTQITGFKGKTDYSAAFSSNIETQKMVQLLRRTTKLYPGQSGLGRIIGNREGTNDVFMPGFIGSIGSKPVYGLLRVDLDGGRGTVIQRGTDDTHDWFVDTDGTVLAREDYDNRNNQYKIKTNRSGKWETIYEEETELGPRGLVGVTPDKSELVFFLKNSDGYNELRRFSFDGEYGPPEMSRANTEIDRVLVDQNRVVHGVAYGGLQPAYDFFDKALAKDVQDMQDQAPHASVRLVDWNDGFKKLIFYIEGTGYAGDYFLLDRDTGDLRHMASSRPDIPREAIGEVLTIEYKAEDGLGIPGIITVPNGSEIKNLPAIILPHGGPESHDEVGFDYMAQYFASRGYLVLQPNFRGSDGFGNAFTEAGYGGWGGVMQQDITDGVAALTKGGMIDPERVCIVGGSYGGYAALAGGAFTPDLYKCVASYAGVSDLPKMLSQERRDHGKHHWVLSYWAEAMASGDVTRETLRAKSPAMFAENFQAPVLLIHGKDDLVVKTNQSRIMEKALKRADKEVEFIQMSGEGHYFDAPGSRLKLLQALDTFISAHIGDG